MYTIFPYAKQHNGEVPKEMEEGIRNGAMQMIIFEELVYQEALRREMTVPPAKLQSAEKDFRRTVQLSRRSTDKSCNLSFRDRRNCCARKSGGRC